MNIVSLLEEKALKRPFDTAFIDGPSGRERFLSFQSINQQVIYFAHKLRENGIKKGDSVLILHPIKAELYVALLSVLRLGAIAVFLDPSAGKEHINRCCKMYPPEGFIGSCKAHLLRVVSSEIRKIPCKFLLGLSLPMPEKSLLGHSLKIIDSTDHINTGNYSDERRSPSEFLKSFSGSNAALITFTSGSTGIPKAISRSHDFLLHQHKVLQSTLTLKQGQLDMATMPIFVLANLGSGVTTFLPDCNLAKPGFVPARHVLRQLNRLQPSTTAASPAFLEKLAVFSMRDRTYMNSLKHIYTGGAPVYPRTLKLIARSAPDAEVIAVYGSTEAEPIAEINYREISDKDMKMMSDGHGLLAGKPVEQIDLRIMKFCNGPVKRLSEGEFSNLCCPEKVAGEIVITGAHVVKGYLNSETEKETKFEVGNIKWHRTGDAGYIDSNGRVWLLGRTSARIECDDKTIYPFAVEAALMNRTGIRRAALLNIKNHALITLEYSGKYKGSGIKGISPDTRDYLRDQGVYGLLELQRIPLDKRHNAKIDYAALNSVVLRSLPSNLQDLQL